jgi:hypothetical protein
MIRERGNIRSIDEIQKQKGGGILYWGGNFPPGGNSILILKIGGNHMLGSFFPKWGKFYPGPVFPGGKTML